MTRPLSSLLLAFTLVPSVPARAELIPIPNPDLGLPPGAEPDKPIVPTGWQVRGATRNAFAVAVGDSLAVALRSGTRLDAKIEVPETTEDVHEFGLLTVDAAGVAGDRPSVFRAELIDRRGRAVASAEGEVAEPIGDGSTLHRAWAWITAKQLARLAGEEATIRLTGRGLGVAFADVRLYRLPRVATRRMLAKPNGPDGPDRVDVGALGFDAFTAHDHAPLPVMSVRDGSPAAEAGLRDGDVILSVDGAPLRRTSCAPGWRWFRDGHEATLARAIDAAIGDPQREGVVTLGVLRDGEPHDIALTVWLRESLGATFPFDDATTDRLHDELIGYVVGQQQPNGRWATGGNDTIQTCFSGLALLGTRDPTHAPRIRKAVDWMLARYPHPADFGGLGFWPASYAGILLAEYHLATGDRRVLPWMQRTLDWAAATPHTSRFGMAALGHGPPGLPYGQKALVAPAVHLLVFEALAERCGVDGRLWELIHPYMEHAWSDPGAGGHGALGYNGSYKDQAEFWSRSGLFALAAHLRGERPDMSNAMTKTMVARHPWMRNSHAYGAPGDAWGLIGLALVHPDGFRDVMKAWRPLYAAAWEPGFGLRYSTPHMGSPYMGEEGLINPAFAAVLSVRRRGLHITGATDRDWLAVPPGPAPTIDITRGTDGRVSIGGSSPESTVRFTLDGTSPTSRSSRYLGPFPMRGAGIVRARAFTTDGAPGAIASAVFSESKAAWSIVAASGHRSPGQAFARATRLIDDDARLPWIPDRGHEAAGFPHYVVVDLGEALMVAEVVVRNGSGDAGVKRVAVRLDADATFDNPPETIDVAAGEDPTWRWNPPRHARYLRLDFLVGHGGALSIREVDVHGPEPWITRDARGRVSIVSGGVRDKIRYTIDGSEPDAASPRFDRPFKLLDGGVVMARLELDGRLGPTAIATFDVSRHGWKARADSEEPDSTATHAIDGDPETMWHSRWRGEAKPPPHELTIDTGRVRDLSGIGYRPRASGDNGLFDHFVVEVSEDGRTWQTALDARLGEPPTSRATGMWRAPFAAPTPGRYVRLTVLSEVHGRPFASAGEITLSAAPRVVR